MSGSARRPPRSYASSDDASGQIIPLLIGTTLFFGSIGAAIQFAHMSESVAVDQVGEGYGAVAEALADTLLGQPGKNWHGTNTMTCTNGIPSSNYQADVLTRLGLAAEVCSGYEPPHGYNLSYDKIQNLKKASTTTSSSNGYVDYPDGRTSLGLATEGLDFHLALQPTLPDVRAALEAGYTDSNPSIAYVGAYDEILNGSPQPTFDPGISCGYSVTLIDLTLQLYRVEVYADITNYGVAATAFEANFTYHLQSRSIDVSKHTAVANPYYSSVPPYLPTFLPGTTVRASVTLQTSSDWAWKDANDKKLYVTIADSVRKLGACVVNLSAVDMNLTPTPQITYHDWAERLEYLLPSGGGGVTVEVWYAAYTGTGAFAIPPIGWRMAMYTSSGLPACAAISLPAGRQSNVASVSCTFTTADAYTAKLETALGGELAKDTFHVRASGSNAYQYTPRYLTSITYDPKSGVVPEITYLDKLASKFEPKVYASTYSTAEVGYLSGGDVYPSLRNVLEDDLLPLLVTQSGATMSTYNTVMIGADVDHSVFDPWAIKAGLRDWVLAGGRLIVLGSALQANGWLVPLFQAATGPGGSGAGPIPTHALLTKPNTLDTSAYYAVQTWKYPTTTDAGRFEHVLVSGVSGNDQLSVSTRGEFGTGRVILSGFQVWNIKNAGATGSCDPTAIQADCESVKITQNMLQLWAADITLDYGPPIPTSSEASCIVRLVNVYHPDLGNKVEATAQLCAFR